MPNALLWPRTASTHFAHTAAAAIMTRLAPILAVATMVAGAAAMPTERFFYGAYLLGVVVFAEL